MRGLCLHLILMFCLSTGLTSQQIRFDVLTTDDGLPSATILDILMDRQGYLWFATYEGLARYDGHSFEVFQQDQDDSASLSGNLTYALLEDQEGYIWVATVGGGVCRFDPHTEKFKRYMYRPGDPGSLSHNFAYALCEDRRGRLWVGTLNGLDLLDPKEGRFRRLFPSKGDAFFDTKIQVTAIVEDDSVPGRMWVGTFGEGLFQLDSTDRIVAHYRADPWGQTSASSNQAHFLYQDPSMAGILWIGTGGGLHKFDKTKGTFSSYRHDPLNDQSISDNSVRGMMKDRSGNLWIGTSGGGLNRFDPATETFVAYRHDPKNSRSVSSNRIISLFQDETGVYWVGTREGLCRFVSPSEQFTVYQHDPDDAESLSDDNVWSLICDSEGYIWIASGGGLNRYDPESETFVAFRHDRRDPSSLRNNLVRTIYEDRKGRLWVGNAGGLLHLFDRRTGRSKSIDIDESVKVRFDIRALLETSDGTFWVGTDRGLYVLDRERWKVKRVSIGPIGMDRVLSNQVNWLFEDSLNVLWIGTNSKGLILHDRRLGTTSVYDREGGGNKYAGLHSVAYVGRSRSGDLWVVGDHLYKFVGGEEAFILFRIAEGESRVGPYGFLEDGADNFWISTHRGLRRFTKETGHVRIFTFHHGLPATEFNSRSFCLAKNGKMYFGTPNGFFCFSPDSIRDNTHVPHVVVTKFRIFEEEFKTDTSLSYLSHIILPHDQNFLSFEYAALDFRDPGENKYAYMLEGLDDDWISADNRRYAAYPDLSPGEYRFRVRASNNNGVWNNEGASLSISILSPWWASWWFRGIILVAVVALINGLYRYRVSRILEMERMRLRIADDLHDDIGSELSAIALESDLIARHLKSEPAQQRRVHDVGSAVRRAAEQLRDVVWIVNPEQDKLGDLVVRMREVTKTMLAGVEISFSSPDGSRDMSLELEFKRNILLMYKEVLNNIMRHAQATKVEILVDDTDGMMHVCVKDNGRGFDRTAATDGRGLKSICARAKSIGGTLTIESTSGSGTKVCFKGRITRT